MKELLVALDVDTADEAVALASGLSGVAGGVKVGSRRVPRPGPAAGHTPQDDAAAKHQNQWYEPGDEIDPFGRWITKYLVAPARTIVLDDLLLGLTCGKLLTDFLSHVVADLQFARVKTYPAA